MRTLNHTTFLQQTELFFEILILQTHDFLATKLNQMTLIVLLKNLMLSLVLEAIYIYSMIRWEVLVNFMLKIRRSIYQIRGCLIHQVVSHYY